jgi:hypothetical protein
MKAKKSKWKIEHSYLKMKEDCKDSKYPQIHNFCSQLIFRNCDDIRKLYFGLHPVPLTLGIFEVLSVLLYGNVMTDGMGEHGS